MIQKPSKQKLLAKFSLSALAVVFIVQLVFAASLFLSTPVQAASPYTMKLEVPIPGLSDTITFTGNTGPIATYIKAIYNYAVGAVGIVAAVVLMIGGLMWITAGGNASNVTEAKSMITASLTGLVLVLVSYLLLDQINPALVNLQITTITPPTVTQASAACKWLTGTKDVPLACDSNSKPTTNFSLCGPLQGTPDRMTCCCLTAALGTNFCSPDKLTAFGNLADQASIICQGESSGVPDKCGDNCDGDNVSCGLFQINLTVWPIGTLNCPDAFQGKFDGKGSPCKVIDRDLYNKCVAAANDQTKNIQEAYQIYSNSTGPYAGWKQWGFYNTNHPF